MQDFYAVGILHDWMISGGKFIRRRNGLVSQEIQLTKEEEELVVLRFDGIYMDSRIYVNGVQAGEWKYGYTTFEVDVTNLLKDGENEIFVSITFQTPNSRWYTGAGIYRNVWLKRLPLEHFVSDGIYFSAKKKRKMYGR